MIWFILSIVTLAVVIVVHDFILNMVARYKKKLTMLSVIMALFISHSAHIWIYAISYYLGLTYFGIGHIEGNLSGDFLDYVYFSATNYTSLGYGDIVAVGGVKHVATFQGLIGLLMIGWSTAFAFWYMQKHRMGDKLID